MSVDSPLADNSVVKFLQSDVTLNIAIFLALLGMVVMSFFIFSLEGWRGYMSALLLFYFVGSFFLCFSILFVT